VKDSSSRSRHEPAGAADLGAAQAFTVNGAAFAPAGQMTVGSLVRLWCACDSGIAVALNSDVVPRSEWDTTTLEAGDRIEIVTAAAGG